MTATPSRALRFHEYGEPRDVLRLDETTVTDPPAGRIRVRVSAVGLNPADWELCRGFMAGSLPRGIGYDVAGIVDAVGDGVDDVAVGDEILGTADFVGQPSAGAADVAILNGWAALPVGLPVESAAALPMVTQTAEWTLAAMGVGADTTLLVHGAGSMVGFAAVQLAISSGARVIATAGPAFAAELERIGATVTAYGEGMVERVRDIAGGPVDLAIDTAPPTPGTVAALVEITGDPSHVVTISNHDEARSLGGKVNLDLLPEADLRSISDVLADAAAGVVDGRFRIPVARVLPLDEWRTAVELSLSRAPHGKIVLLP